MPQLKTGALDGEIGLRVRGERLARGWSQATLAEKIGTSYQQIHKYERGVNRISSSTLLKLAAIFGMPVAELIGEAPSESVVPPRSRAAMNLMRDFAGLPVPYQDAITKLVHAIARKHRDEGETTREAAQ